MRWSPDQTTPPVSAGVYASLPWVCTIKICGPLSSADNDAAKDACTSAADRRCSVELLIYVLPETRYPLGSIGTSVFAGTPLSSKATASTGASSTGRNGTVSNSSNSSDDSACPHSSVIAGRAANSSGASRSVTATAGESPSSSHKSPSSHRSARSGKDRQRDSAAAANESLPAVTKTIHMVPAATSIAFSRRTTPANRNFFRIPFTSGTTYASGIKSMLTFSSNVCLWAHSQPPSADIRHPILL